MNIVQFDNGWISRWLRHTMFLLLGVGLSINASLSIANSQAPAAGKPVLLVLGDSLSAAYGMPSEQGWVALLQQQLPGYRVVNASISGETTSGGKQRLPALMKQYQPQLLIIELAANDALRGQDLMASKRNLQSMVGMCKNAVTSCTPVLLGVRLPTNYGPAYDRLLQQVFASVAADNQLAFDPFFLEPVVLDPDLMQWDGLHPNAKAQPVILERVMLLLDTVLPDKE